MSYQQPYAGYPGSVWTTCWQANNWLNNLLASGTASPNSVVAGALACYQTFANGADAVAAYQAAQAFGAEQINMAQIQALPISLDPTTLSYFTARVASIAAAASGVAAIPPAVNPFAVTGLLNAGQPAVPYPGYLEWCVGFNAEAVPSGMVAPSSLPTYASGAATAWLTVTNAVRVYQGNLLTNAYDTAARQFRVSSVIASGVSGLATTYTQASLSSLWNGAVAMPSLLLDVGSLTNSPSSLANQQAATIRFGLRLMALTVGRLLLSLRAVASGSVTTAQLRRNETLMDLAARSAGNYEEWSTIAALNNIQPPYPGPTNQAVAASGTALLLPGSVVQPSGVVSPTYALNVLGADYDFGPINGAGPQWTGDIPLIVGYANFTRALGRRIQTTLGTLFYHPDYGSRIPPEVGAIQNSDEAARLAAFGAAALQADPRTGSVLSAVATVQPGFLATFSGVVQPIGPESTPVSTNNVINNYV